MFLCKLQYVCKCACWQDNPKVSLKMCVDSALHIYRSTPCKPCLSSKRILADLQKSPYRGQNTCICDWMMSDLAYVERIANHTCLLRNRSTKNIIFLRYVFPSKSCLFLRRVTRARIPAWAFIWYYVVHKNKGFNLCFQHLMFHTIFKSNLDFFIEPNCVGVFFLEIKGDTSKPWIRRNDLSQMCRCP